MQFDLDKSLEILERTPIVINSWLFGISEDWTLQNEGEATWSARDVVAHLIYCEKADWLMRAEIILSEQPDLAWKPFDRNGHVKDSEGKSLPTLLSEFKTLRKTNLQRLKDKELDAEKFQMTGLHPAFGNVTLSQLLSSWVVHDLNHIAQIARVMAHQYREATGPWVEYMGIYKKRI